VTQPPPPNGSWNPGPGGWPQGYPSGQPGPQWNPQQGWPPAPQKRGFAKWIIGGVALVGVIAVTAVVAVSCTKSSGGTDKPTASPTTSGAPASDFASANDTGPVSVITEDPSCAPWVPVQQTLADSEKNGWAQRDPSLPADVWTPEIRSQYEAVRVAMRNAADQTEPLLKMTPSRVMRELYGQFISYARAYAERIPLYEPPDNELGNVANYATQVISDVCQAIDNGSAAARASRVAATSPPNKVLPASTAEPTKFMSKPDSNCDGWERELANFDSDPRIVAWRGVSPNIPAGQWTPEQRAINDAAIPAMEASANELERLGRESNNAVSEDIAGLAAQYRRAFAAATPTYSPADTYLENLPRSAIALLISACKSAGGT
jgi:hypothetical protein